MQLGEGKPTNWVCVGVFSFRSLFRGWDTTQFWGPPIVTHTLCLQNLRRNGANSQEGAPFTARCRIAGIQSGTVSYKRCYQSLTSAALSGDRWRICVWPMSALARMSEQVVGPGPAWERRGKTWKWVMAQVAKHLLSLAPK